MTLFSLFTRFSPLCPRPVSKPARLTAVTDATLAYLSLSHAKGLGPRKIKLLVEHFGSAAAVLEAAQDELLAVEKVGPSLARAVLSAKESDWPEREVLRAERLNVALVHLEDPRYPESLKAVYDPPSVLYVRGELPTQPKAVGMVGTRDASEYALRLTEQLARDLAGAGVVVVSGLALGVDTAAHRGALSAPGGLTVAVLGSGVDVVYPRQNQDLAKTIFSGRGALVSEYPLGTGPRSSNFPGRNRIINGLASGVVVVEAGAKSGALITADYASEEGRTVFAVPGRVGDPRSSGTLALLKQGAVLVQDVDDVLNELGWDAGSSRHPAPTPPDLPPQEAALLEAIRRLGNPLLDDLVAAAGKSAAELLPLLTMLELKGQVKVLPGGRYTRL